MKLSVVLVFILTCFGSFMGHAVAKKQDNTRRLSKKAAKGSPGDTPTPAPANQSLPTTYNGPAFAALPPPAATELVPVDPTYQHFLNQFTGVPAWTEELPIVDPDHPNENKEHDPKYYWDKIWPKLKDMDPETLHNFMKWMFTSDVGASSFEHAVECMVELEVQERTATARQIAEAVLADEEQKIETQFATRTPKGKAEMRDTCRRTFSEKLEIDLKTSADQFRERCTEKAQATTDHSHYFANPDEFWELSAQNRQNILGMGGALAIFLQNHKKKRRAEKEDVEDDDGKPPAKKNKRDRDQDGDSSQGL